MRIDEQSQERCAEMRYEDIKVGSVYSFEKEVTRKDVMDFAQLTGDFSRLHVDEAFGRKSKFGRNIAHGMLIGSLFSRIVGMYCPGEKSLYLSQTLLFKSPIYYGDRISVNGTVTGKSDSIRIVTMKIEIMKGAKIAIAGTAKIMVLEQ